MTSWKTWKTTYPNHYFTIYKYWYNNDNNDNDNTIQHRPVNVLQLSGGYTSTIKFQPILVL